MIRGPLLLGVHRERGHSPGHEANDPAILQATAAALRARGHQVRTCLPEDLERELAAAPALVFAMCETPPALAALDKLVAAGVPVFNSPRGIRNTYRYRMLRKLAKAPIRVPASETATLADNPAWPQRPVWLKRYDYHATQPGDVLFADGAAAWSAALERFRARGFARAIVQDHVPGDLVKFYGVADAWFRWFHDRNHPIANHPFDPASLARAGSAAAAALELPIFGGDAIVGPGHAISIIDLNAWPSYARFRNEAGEAIAAFLEKALAMGARLGSAAAV
jgi:hypothetical protein